MATETCTAEDRVSASLAPCPVADTMRRVHEELRRGTPRSFEALLAYGVPEVRSRPTA